MSGSWMAFFEIFLVFGAVFGFGFYELSKLKKPSKHSVLRGSQTSSLTGKASSDSSSSTKESSR